MCSSACPLEAETPIEASGIIPVNQNDVANIPALALSIPDFEGQAILRIFSNSTETEIGCYTAVVTNGSSFSHPDWVSTILGVFTIIAVLSSFGTAIYGDNMPEMRKHYAHSFSVLVTFAVWQHIYFSGALSLNWPSVLVAFWSNYAWSGGMIYNKAMQNTINKFIGSDKGNTTAVGAAGTGYNPGLGGGFDISQIYKRDVHGDVGYFERVLAKRELVDSVSGFSWYGHPVNPGIPLPGNYSGLAGTLAQSSIPASNAFMTGLLWFLVLVAGVGVSVIAFALLLKALRALDWIKPDRLAFFQTHWLRFQAFVVLRTLLGGFFLLMYLCMFQFSYLASPRPVAVACVVFLFMLLGMGGLVGYACFHRIKFGTYVFEPDRLNIEKKNVLKAVPWYFFSRNSRSPRSEDKTYVGSVAWWRVHPELEEESIHDDEKWMKLFGWLTARFRRTKWWFFTVWLVYEFIRACFLAGASASPAAQVFGLLVVEIVAFIALIIVRPFEGQRLNLVAVYFLGFSKVVTTGLSTAFLSRFGISRIVATVIGIVIIVIQGILTITVLICIILGAITSYMSVMRNREIIHPTRWLPFREKYFNHLNFQVKDIPKPPKTKPELVIEPVLEPEPPKGPYFSVNAVRRIAKVEDEDKEFMNEIHGDSSSSQKSSTPHDGNSPNGTPMGRSRAPSLHSQMSFSSLPYGARVHRASWSTLDFAEQHGSARPRAWSNLAYSPEGGTRPPHKTLTPINTRMANAEDLRDPSPPSASASQFVTPMSSPRRGDNSRSPIPRPRSTPRRPPLRTLNSESELPPPKAS